MKPMIRVRASAAPIVMSADQLTAIDGGMPSGRRTDAERRDALENEGFIQVVRPSNGSAWDREVKSHNTTLQGEHQSKYGYTTKDGRPGYNGPHGSWEMR